jgi:hypothetical protein
MTNGSRRFGVLFFGIALVLVQKPLVEAQTESEWLLPVSEDWGNATNWSSDPVAPTTADYFAVIDAQGAAYEVVSTTNVSLDRLRIDSADAALNIAGGVFSTLNGIDIAAGTLKFTGGRIENTRVAGNGTFVIPGGASTPFLSGVTLATDASVNFGTNSNQYFVVEESLRLEEATLDVAGTRTRFAGSGTIGGSGELRVDSTVNHGIEGIWVIETGVTLSLYGMDSRWYGTQGSSRLVNRGHIAVEPNAEIDLFTRSSSSIGSMRNEGTITIGEGARLLMRVKTQFAEIGTGVGNIEFRPNSSLWLGSDFLFYLDEPIHLPDTALLELAGSWINETQIVVAPGGTLRLHSDGARADMGDIDVRGATVELSDAMTIADVQQLQASNETTFKFDFGGSVDLQAGTWNLADVTGTWDLRRASISNGTLTGLDESNVVNLPDSTMALDDVRLETPLEITAGDVYLYGASVVAEPITVNGGALQLGGEWTSESEIRVSAGELWLNSLSSQPGSIQMTAGTLVVDYLQTLSELLALSVGSPDIVVVLTPLNLEGDTLDVGSEGWALQVGKPISHHSGSVSNGTIADSSGNKPLQLQNGSLTNVEILADVVTGSSGTLGGTFVTARRMTFSGNTVNATGTSLLLDEVTIDGGMSFSGTNAEIINGLTVNGVLQLNTRRVRMTGDQIIDGTGEITTSGFRSIPGGGLQVADGVLTLGENLTFHSRRRESLLEAIRGGIINRGTIMTGIDEYGESQNDLEGPSIILRADTFEQTGTLVAIENYDLRVEVDQWANEGTIDLAGGGLIVAGTSFRNAPEGQITGNGTLDVAATDFVNEGLVSPGASAGVLKVVGGFAQSTEGLLAIEIGGMAPGDEYDQLQITGTAAMGGTLDVSLINGFSPAAGQSFDILDWESAAGTFTTVELPVLNGPFQWDTTQLYTSGVLRVILPGDFNFDDSVDAADYVAWRKSGGEPQGHQTWRANFGRTAGVNGGTLRASALQLAVPEPSAIPLLIVWLAVASMRRRRCCFARPSGR